MKRGLRDATGRGVLTSLTRISEVKGYTVDGQDTIPCPGVLYYRGYDVRDLEARALDAALILHADHGSNSSTFTNHVTTSTGTDTYSAMTASLCSLKGPRHGGANAKVVQMMADLRSRVRDPADPEQVRQYLTDLRQAVPMCLWTEDKPAIYPSRPALKGRTGHFFPSILRKKRLSAQRGIDNRGGRGYHGSTWHRNKK